MNLLTDTIDGREDIEINDLRVGANRIIEIMQKEIKVSYLLSLVPNHTTVGL